MSSKKKNFKLKYFHLCDFASVTADGKTNYGKTNLLGIFEKIVVRKLPTTIPHIYIVFNIESTTNNELPFDLALKGSSGKELFAQKIEGRLDIPEGKKLATINGIVQINNLPIKEVGEYELLLSCGDELIAKEKLIVEQLPQKDE